MSFNAFLDRLILVESSIDFPKDTLAKDVWNWDGEKYVLKPYVKKKIFELIDSYTKFPIRDYMKGVHITGSIGTNQYRDNTDIDVHILVNGEEIKNFEDIRKDIQEHLKTNINQHPLEIYLQDNEVQEYLSDAVYDVLNDKWIKGPLLLPKDFNPYEYYKHLSKEINALSQQADVSLGELKRDLIDYEYLSNAVKGLDKESKEKLAKSLSDKIEEIEKDLEEIISEYEYIRGQRKAYSQPKDKEEALHNPIIIKKWKDKNAIFKFLDRYNYLRIMRDLKRSVELGDGLDKDEIDLVKGIMGVEG